MKELTSDYGALLLMILLTTLVGVGMIAVSYIFGKKAPRKRKLETFECGMPILDSVKKRFSVKFFIVAVLFIIFDVEAAFLYPWILISRDAIHTMTAAIIAVSFFVLFVALVFIYLLKERAFEWDR